MRPEPIDGMVWIYGLAHPSVRQVRYVGQSVDPAARLTQHIAEARRAHRQGNATGKDAWILRLLGNRRRPLLEPLALVPMQRADEMERMMIALYGLSNALFNVKGRGGILPTVEKPEMPDELFVTREGLVRMARDRMIGRSQRQLASELGVTQPMISKALRGSYCGIPCAVPGDTGLLPDRRKGRLIDLHLLSQPTHEP